MTNTESADSAGEGGELKTLFTLADARRHDACKSGYNRFKEALRKAYPDTDIETVRWSIGDVARVNLDDALWCFCMVNDNRTRVAAVMPAVRRASAHTTDERVVFCIGEIDRWLAGDDSVDLGAEGDAARAAAGAAEEVASTELGGTMESPSTPVVSVDPFVTERPAYDALIITGLSSPVYSMKVLMRQAVECSDRLPGRH